jgi:hypothetical protein
MTTRSRDENTEVQDIKRFGQAHTFDSNPSPQAPVTPLESHT